MGGERASSMRQRYAGKICCECKAPLPPPNHRGERLCDRCGGAGKKRVYMHFILRKGWFCQFLEDDLKTALPKTIRFTDDKKNGNGEARRLHAQHFRPPGASGEDPPGNRRRLAGAYPRAVCEAAEAIMRVLHRRSVVFTI
jgi:hypothetical protein